MLRGEIGEMEDEAENKRGGAGQAYIEIGIAWCSDSSRGLVSRSRVSKGEKTYMGGAEV